MDGGGCIVVKNSDLVALFSINHDLGVYIFASPLVFLTLFWDK